MRPLGTRLIQSPLDLSVRERGRIELGLEKALLKVAGNASWEKRHAFATKLIQKGLSKKESQEFIKSLEGFPLENRWAVGSMIENGLHPDLVLLYVKSPTNESRKALEQSWLKGTPRHEWTQQIVDRSGNVGSMLFLAGTLSVSAAVVYGQLTSDPAAVEAGGIVSGYFPSTVGEVFELIASGNNPIMAAAAWSTYQAAMGVAKILQHEPVTQKTDKAMRDLQDRVNGVFERKEVVLLQGRPLGIEAVLRELENVKPAYSHILTHLEPRELVLFLASDDEVRAQHLSINRPGFRQRMDTASALAPKVRHEVEAKIQETFTVWDNPLMPLGKVTLTKSLSELRKDRQERLQINTLPLASSPKLSGPGA